MKNEVLNKLYLNPIVEINLNRKRLNPIKQRNISLSPTHHLTNSRSVIDLFKNLNGSVIIQNWNTKRNVPKDIGEFINLPSLIDLNKINNNLKKLDKPTEKLSLLDKIKTAKFMENNGKLASNKSLIIETNLEENLSSRNTKNRFNYSKRSLLFKQKLKRSSSTISNRINQENMESLVPYNENNKNGEKETNSNNQIITTNIPANNNSNLNSLIKLNSPRVFKFKKIKLLQKDEPIDFSKFKQHLFLRDNDFLYARRVGGPVDFALCSFSDIIPPSDNKFSSGRNKINKNIEYITISKNTILHYLKGKPILYSIKEWTDNYVKFKKLLKIPLFKNFKSAGLFDIWKRFYRKKKRVLYTEKLRKKTYFVDRHLIRGLLDIRRIFKEMTYYELFKLNITSPIYLNTFSQLYFDGLEYNNKKLDEYRSKVKKLLSNACAGSYKAFRKAKNISLDDTDDDDNGNEEEKKDKDTQEENYYNRNKRLKQENQRNIKLFMKEAIPYAQDATRKKHFKKLLKFIRLIDFLFNYSKFDLIINSLNLLEKKFARLYEAYEKKYTDNPILIATIVTLGNKISYNPSMELVISAIFDHFILENIDLVTRIKNFIDPQEFPKYMVCFEETFEVSVDQNGILNGRIKDDDNYNDIFDSIKSYFDKCRKALDDTAQNLVPILANNNKYMKTNFTTVEKEANHTQLKEYISEFKKMEIDVRKLNKKLNIGIFEFRLDLLLDQVLNSPQYLLGKIFTCIPKILIRKIHELVDKTDRYNELINIDVNRYDVEAFLKLKKEVEQCSNNRNKVEEEMEEINELYLIVNNHHKDMKLEDYEKRVYDHLLNSRTNYERKLDSMLYFIEQNIKIYRSELMIKIRKYDEMLKKIYVDLNNDIVNKYSDDTSIPLLYLEEKYYQISKAIENKKIFQQQEKDIEMIEMDKSNFENLDLVTYEYELKKEIWTNIREYQKITMKWEKIQIMDIKTEIMDDKIYNWKNSCLIGIKDLVDCQVAKDFLFKIKIYEKVLYILKIVQNENIQKNDFLRDSLKKIMNLTNMEFTDSSFLFEKLLNMKGLYDAIPSMEEINTRANEEQRLVDLLKVETEIVYNHIIPLTLRVSQEKNYSKFIITNDDLAKEEKFIEKNISILNKEILNKYISEVKNDYEILINKMYKYQNFLYLYYDYQCYILRLDNIIYNPDFIKECPSDFKKISSESMTKSLMKTLKESVNLGRYLDVTNERIINNLKIIINNYETSYKGIHNFLNKRRKEFQDYYLLSDKDLIQLIENKDSYEIRQKLTLKMFPYIKYINPGKDTDENFTIVTKSNKEEITLRYIKGIKNLNDTIESIESGITKKIKDNFKQFKRNFDASIKPNSKKKPKDIINDLLNIETNNSLYQTIFICLYHIFYYFLEKTLEKESEAFDKLFDFYNTVKDDWRKKYIKILQNNKNNSKIKIKISICAIAIWDYFIKSVENLLREDVRKNTDYTYNKIIQIKVENDSVMIKLFHFIFEYGNEYIGLQYDFFFLPQTEKTFISIINALYYHNSFIIYNNQTYFKKEILNIISNILGRKINYFTANENLSISGINNLIYGYIRSGQFICVTNTEKINFNIYQCLADRINEVFQLLKSRQDEGYFIDRDGEKYLVNGKRFNIFLTYDVENPQIYYKSFEIPYCVKYGFRCIGINYIEYKEYLKLALNCYGIQNSEEITNKILFILDVLIDKCKLLNRKNLKRIIFQFLIDNILKKIIKRRNEIDKNKIYNIIKICLKETIMPFLQANEEDKKDFEVFLNMILFDYKEIEKNNEQKMNKINANIKNNNEIIPNKNLNIEKEKQNEILLDKACDEILSKFSFDNDDYKNKLKSFYTSLNHYQSFALLGPTLTGKSNLFVEMRDLSLKLQEINGDFFPVFNYIKCFPNHKDYSEIFVKNHINHSYQINNIYFKNLCDIIRREGPTMDDLHQRYKKMQFELYYNIIENNITKNQKEVTKVKKEEKDIIEIINDEMMDDLEPINEKEEFDIDKLKKNGLSNDDKEDKEQNLMIKEEEKSNKNEEDFGDEISKLMEEEEEDEEQDEKSIESNKKENINSNNINNEEKSTIRKKNRKPYKAIVFDGSISPYWFQYLVNYLNEYNLYLLSEGEYINLSKNKLIYETSSISRVSPAFITRQNIISLTNVSFNWLNISYAYVEQNYKTTKNEELKNYIKGLFENYGGSIIDFVEINKLKCIQLVINPNYIIKNLINLFNAFLPEFDFVEVTLGRKKPVDYVPKIELIKKQTLSIFIFCCSWIMNLLTNFLIRNKIEKTVSDIFKSDDLKGPIFDYYICYNENEQNYNYCLWSDLLNNNIYKNPIINKESIYYYGHDFITTIGNLPYQYIINQLLLAQTPLLVIGKPSTGKSFIINKCIKDLLNDKKIKYTNINCTYKTTSSDIEKKIVRYMDIINRKDLGDKYLRKNVIFIDDVHLNKKNNQFNEYMRYLLNIKSMYDPKHNTFKYFRDFNIINSGNVYNNIPIKKFNNNNNNLNNYDYEYDYEEHHNNYEDFIRYCSRFSLICLNLSQNNYINTFKLILESYLRNYNPNTSSILSNSYISILIKLNEFLKQEIDPTYKNLHYFFNINDITKILQRFNMYIFKDIRDYNEYIKKIFLYESYLLYTNKFTKSSENEIFTKNFIKAYNIYFKQDKIDDDIFKDFDKDNNYIFCKNFIDIYGENPEGKYIAPKDLEYVYIDKKIEIKQFLISKIKSFYSENYIYGGAKGIEEESYIINEFNDEMLDNIIRILNLLNNEYPNLVLIGKKQSGKELLAKIGLFIMRFKYEEININKLISQGKYIFEKDSIVKIVNDAIFNNTRTFIFFQNDIFDNINDDDKLYILEIISLLLNQHNYFNKFNIFRNNEKIKTQNQNHPNQNMNINIYNQNDSNNNTNTITKNKDEENSIQLKENEKMEKMKSNINIILSIDNNEEIYRRLFLDYSSILNSCYTIYIKEYTNESLKVISNHIFENNKSENDFGFTMSNTLSKTLFDIFSFIKSIYEEFTLKLNLRISLNQRHYMSMCQFISDNYKKYKQILIKNRENYQKININIKKIEELLKQKEILIENLKPQKEQIDKLIEECLKTISNKNMEKKQIKSNKNVEEKKCNEAMNLKTQKNAKLDEIFLEIKDSIKKTISSLQKLTDKDILEIKNSWDNFPIGKYLLSKIFDAIDIFHNANNITNYDYEYIKKNISTKHFKKLSNINYTNNNPQFIELIKNVANNQEYSLNEKFSKPFKLANLLCDYFNKINKFYILSENNVELLNEITNLDNVIEEHKTTIKKYLNEYNIIEKEILEINGKISSYETTRNNSQIQIDKIKALITVYQMFLDISNKKIEAFRKKEEKNLYLLKYFDFYIIYISSYIHFAPILNNHYREHLKSYLNECLNNIKNSNDKKEKNYNEENDYIDFIELIYNFMDITGKEKELYMNSNSFSDFLKENFIFIHLFKDKVPLIIDFTQFGKNIINDYIQFEKQQDFLTISFNNFSNYDANTNNNNEANNRGEQVPKNDFKEKLEKSTKLGWNLFIDNIIDINKIYYLFFDYINMRYTGDKANKNILINDQMYTINETFKLFLFKNTFGSVDLKNDEEKKSSIFINDNIWFNLLFINFNLSKEDLKERIFNSVSLARNQQAFNALKKSKNNTIKRIISKVQSEKNMINSMLQVDLSGNEEKLTDFQFFNEQYNAEYQIYCESQEAINSLESKYKKQIIGLNDNYDKISIDCSRIYKWLYRFNLFEISYKIDSNTFINYILEFFDEKFSINNEINIMNIGGSSKNLNLNSTNVNRKISTKSIAQNKKKIIEEDEDYDINENEYEDSSEEENEKEDGNKKVGVVADQKAEVIIPVKKENYIYKSDIDAKSLIIFLYNKIKNIFVDRDIKKSLLLIFGFICINLQSLVPIRFKQIFNNCYILNQSYEKYFDENKTKKSPIETISNQSWTILDKLNMMSGDLLGDILDNINNNKEKWNYYLNEKYNDFNNYYFYKLKLLDDDLDKRTNSLIKFIFFYTIKPEKHEFILNTFLDRIFLNENCEINNLNYYWNNNERYNSLYIKKDYEDYDITKAFKNYNAQKDHALVLIAPHNNINIYDKILYEHCYLKMFLGMGGNNIDNQNKTHFADKTITNTLNNFNIQNNNNISNSIIQNNVNNNLNNINNINNQNNINSNNVKNANNNTIANIQNAQNNNNLDNENLDKTNINSNNVNKKGISRKETLNKADQSGFNLTTSGVGTNTQIFQSMSDTKYKEIILESNNYMDLSQQDLEFIRNSIRTGNVIVIKNAHFLEEQFNEIIKELNEIRNDDISLSFKLILICDINEVIKNKSIYEHCRIINDNLLYEESNLGHNRIKIPVKERIINLIYKIPFQVYAFILNSQNYFMRLFLRKIIFHYITVFGILQNIELSNPFIFTINDFIFLCQYIITYFEHENFTEEKYNEFINIENATGFNYASFINILDNIFIYSRQIGKEDEYKINKFISELFDYKIFMHPDYYLKLGNIKIRVNLTDETSTLNYDLSCEDIYKSFNQFSIEEFEELLPDINKEELIKSQYDNANKIFKNLITSINMNFFNEKKIIKEQNFDLVKIKKNLEDLAENIPHNIQYKIEEYNLDLENVDLINPSFLKKNKYGFYFNYLDDSLYYEIIYFNRKLEYLHIQIKLILSMINGERLYNNFYYQNFELLNKGLIPNDFNIINTNETISQKSESNKNDNENNWDIKLFKKIMIYRIKLFKAWLKDGCLAFYHLPLFHNIHLFLNDLKMYFCRKYYGENDYSKVTPEMISFKFIITKSPTYEDLCSSKDKNLNYYNNLYNSEIIWVNGLILQNAKLDKDFTQYLIVNQNNEKTKQKMNMIGITYSISKYKTESEDNGNNEEKENQEEKNEESNGNESNTESYVTESKNYSETGDIKDNKNETHNNDIDAEEQNEIVIKERKIKVYIYEKKNRCKYHKHYIENSIGFMEFFVNNDKIDQNYIFEHDIKIYVDEFGELDGEDKKKE